MISELYKKLCEIALDGFGEIVVRGDILKLSSGAPQKLRLYLVDSTYVDIWISPTGKYSYHWEQGGVRGLVFRHDNAPHKRWRHVRTFPKHFHNGTEEKVVESDISDDPEEAIKEFLSFIKKEIERI